MAWTILYMLTCKKVITNQPNNNWITCKSVIHAVASSNINSQFSNTITTKFVIAEIAQLNANNAADNGDFSVRIFHGFQPFQI